MLRPRLRSRISRRKAEVQLRAFEFVRFRRHQRFSAVQALGREISVEDRCLRQASPRERCTSRPLRRAARGFARSDIGFETNEPDIYALEEALRLKEKHGGEVVAISMGPERVKQTIKEALAKGADRGIHVLDAEFYQARSAWLRHVRWPQQSEAENFDLILTGLQSDDQGFGQTGVLLAELLGPPACDDHHGHRSD